MNDARDPNLTADLPAAAVPTPDPLATVDQLRGSAGTEESPPATRLVADPLPVIPGYRVLGEIARGGMGRVLAARDLTLDRDVAVKVLLPGADAGRFVRESKITARLPHPGVPPVYALGALDDGSPFLAMKLVAGQTLAVELKAGARLPLLQVFAQVCQAVGFAHIRGVVHRDLKPANVMVGAFGEVQVMDWGLAKDVANREAANETRATGAAAVTDPHQTVDANPPGESTERRTEVGLVMGTPSYMAPEQARGEPTDVRGDVFALGGILCAILTGHPPFRGNTSREVIRRAASGDLADALKRLDECGADAELVGLCRRCLSAVPAERPASGQTVADEIAAYQSRVQDRLQTAERERAVAAAKVVEERRRRKVLVVAASLVVLVLAAGVTGTTLGMFEAKRQKQSAEEGWGKAETETSRAVQNFATARALVLDMGTRITQIETGQSDPRLADLARKQALDKAREQFEQFRSGHPDDVTVQSQAAALHRYAANVSRLLSDYQAAATAYNAALRIYEDLATRFPDNPIHRDDLAETLADRASLEKRMGKLKDAAATLERALKIAEGQEGIYLDSKYRRTLGVIANDQADVAYRLGRFDDTARFARRTRELFDRLKTVPAVEQMPTDPVYLAMSSHRLALARRELGQTAEALAAHDDAVAQMKGLVGPKASRTEWFWDCEVRREWARTAATIPERRDAAADDLVEVIRGMEKLVEESPQIAFYREGLAAAYLRQGELLLLLDKPEPATAVLEKSLTVSRELIDRFGRLSASVLVRGQTYLALGRARAAAGKGEAAVSEWKKAVTLFEAGLTIDPDNFHHNRGLTEAKRALTPPTK